MSGAVGLDMRVRIAGDICYGTIDFDCSNYSLWAADLANKANKLIGGRGSEPE